ncbi:hypothetical protein AST03_05085 [Staphylococcus equorum]|nr:hypothetical protein AST03_05085 [Staphylococcus equorum]
MNDSFSHNGGIREPIFPFSKLENPILEFVKLHGSIMSFGRTKKSNQYEMVHAQKKSTWSIAQKRAIVKGQKCLYVNVR